MVSNNYHCTISTHVHPSTYVSGHDRIWYAWGIITRGITMLWTADNSNIMNQHCRFIYTLCIVSTNLYSGNWLWSKTKTGVLLLVNQFVNLFIFTCSNHKINKNTFFNRLHWKHVFIYWLNMKYKSGTYLCLLGNRKLSPENKLFVYKIILKLIWKTKFNYA